MVYILIYRDLVSPRFTPDLKEPFGMALRGMKRFHYQQLLSHGLLIAAPPPDIYRTKCFAGITRRTSGKGDRKNLATKTEYHAHPYQIHLPQVRCQQPLGANRTVAGQDDLKN